MGKGVPASIDPYATHIHLLAKAVSIARRDFNDLPILELGCGNYSTPLLAQFGPVHVLSTDPSWAKQFRDIATVRILDSWNQLGSLQGEYCLAFQDSEESVRARTNRLPFLLSIAKHVVMHDWREDVKQPACSWSHTAKRFRPWTWWGTMEDDVVW